MNLQRVGAINHQNELMEARLMSFRDRSFTTTANQRSNGYVRDLGGYERLMYLGAIDHPKHFCVVGEIAGELTAGDLRTAFDEVQRRHPLLNVAIEDYDLPIGGSGAAFHRVTSPIDIEFKPLWQDYDWVREVEHELAMPFDGAPGPLMRAIVLQRRQKAQIVLTFHHAIADGLSAAFIIRDLMVALNGHTLPAFSVKPSCDTLAAKLLIPGRRPEEKLGGEKAPRAASPLRIRRDLKGGVAAVTTLSLSEVLTEQIHVTAKAHGTTVHGALCAALALSALEENPSDAYATTSPINIRRMLGLQAGECGIYLAAATVSFSKRDAGEYWAMARQVTEECNQAKSAERVMGLINTINASVPPGASPETANYFRSTFPHNAVLSNLGRLPIPETVGHLRLNALWGPLMRTHTVNERFIGAATVGNRLRIVQSSSADVPSILDLVWAHIRQAVKASA